MTTDTERAAFEAWWGCKYVSQSPEEDSAWEAWQARAAAPANKWREAIDEAMVTAHIGVAEGDPYDCLNRLLEWHHDIWLDPAVCSEAQALIDKGKAEAKAELAAAPAQSAQAKCGNTPYDEGPFTIAQPAPRTLLEQHDLEQSADYRKGYEDGRLRGFDVGLRYGKEQAQPAPQGEPVAHSAAAAQPVAQPTAGVQALGYGSVSACGCWTSGTYGGSHFEHKCAAHQDRATPPAAPEPPAAEMKTLTDAEISELWRQAAEREYTGTTETLVRSFARAIERALAAKNGAKT
jgi:pyruvate/2-oxoglutarate dehydrogenase complex dihydrolipoamide acyltransferase (E2) component